MGDIIFWEKDDYEEYCIMYGTQSCGNFSSEEPMLIAVKYIGNGVFEEMLTREKLLAEGYDIQYEDNPRFTGQSIAIGYVNAKEGRMLEEEVYKNIYKIEIAKEVSKNYSMVLYDGEGFYEVNEESKNGYLKFSDDQKRMVFRKLKEEALEKAKKFVQDLDESLKGIDLSKVQDKQSLDIAYLDNQLFDFENKERRR